MSAPQPLHLPPLHVPFCMPPQLWPSARQMLFTQHALLPQTLPEQHACPGPPQVTHVPFEQRVPVSHVLPVQQACPALPQAVAPPAPPLPPDGPPSPSVPPVALP